VWEFDRVSGKRQLHQNQKPLDLVEQIIKKSSNEHDVVLDCFAGSGTTGVACMNLNRDCIMMELENEYCDIILKRMAENDQKRLI
jgi:site-specific DNA-methyltransferase (adenine-specific)